MMLGNSKSIESQIGAARNGERPPPFLRYCPECAMIECYVYGEPYWHRDHQLLMGTCCVKHGVRLTPSTVPRDPVSRKHKLVPASDVVWYMHGDFSTPDETERFLSERSVRVLHEGKAAFSESLGLDVGMAADVGKSMLERFSAHRLQSFGLNPYDGGPNWIRAMENPLLATSPAKRILVEEAIACL